MVPQLLDAIWVRADWSEDCVDCCLEGQMDSLMVGYGQCWDGTQAEFEGSPERGVAGCFRGWKGFQEGLLQLGPKEGVGKRKFQASVYHGLGRLWPVSIYNG